MRRRRPAMPVKTKRIHMIGWPILKKTLEFKGFAIYSSMRLL